MSVLCDHETPGHWQALAEARAGSLRRCPVCGASARRVAGPYWGWSEPSAEFLDRVLRERHVSVPDTSRVSSNWSEPRQIPWLPWDHPNAMVTSHREAMRVCRDWGIDPERGGFISEKHKANAFAAARRNRREAVAKMSPADQAQRQAARAPNVRSRVKKSKKVLGR